MKLQKLMNWIAWIPLTICYPAASQTNSDPIAIEDAVTAVSGSEVRIRFATLLSNDIDDDSERLFIRTVDDSENGIVRADYQNSVITFTPENNDVRLGTFIYGIADIEDSNDYARMGFTRVTITFEDTEITEDLPIAIDDIFVLNSNAPITITSSELLANDFDPDGDPLQVTLIDDWSGGAINFDLEQGKVVFTPETNFTEGQFTYGIADNDDRSNYARMGFARVMITSQYSPDIPDNQPPIAQDDVFEVTSADPFVVAFESLTNNDSDPEGQAVHVVLAQDGINGSVIFDSESTTITFLPTEGFVEGGFTYGISDNAEENAPSRVQFGFVSLRLNDTGQPAPKEGAFATRSSTQRFLTQATFGPKKSDLDQLVGTQATDWFLDELEKPASLLLSEVDAIRALPTEGDLQAFRNDIAHRFAFFKNAINGDDQLRQRMAFALSEILVISEQDPFLADRTRAIATYQDLLITHAFGNYRDLLEDVTYSPAMGAYLTYAGNRKGDPDTGRTPDENYAREIMQLFSIGVLALEQNGELRLNSSGEPIETYDNNDITGLARVFTGLYYATPSFGASLLDTRIETTPMTPFNAFHSALEKHFLDITIPANTPITESIDIALDTLIEHPNTAPFIGRQLIQRLVTSHPSPEYVERVSQAFIAGHYQFSDGRTVGDGRRGDLTATLASILFDEQARAEKVSRQPDFGKVREPILRVTQWARAFDAQNVTFEYALNLWNLNTALGQQAYSSPSVFNFFRPGYVAPGSETGNAGLNAPELQTTSSASFPDYTNFISFLIQQRLQTSTDTTVGTQEQIRSTLRADYSEELLLADSPLILVNAIDALLTGGRLSSSVKSGIVNTLHNIPLIETDTTLSGPEARVHIAIYMIMTSPEYLVQR